MAVTSSHSLETAWWFFSAFEHCATGSDEIDDTSSAVTSERQWNVSDARLPSISKHLRRTTAPSFTPTRAIVVQGPLDDDSYAAETASLDRDPLLIHDVSILPSELTDVVRYAEYRDTREPPIVWFNIRQRLWIAVGGSRTLCEIVRALEARFYNFLNNDFITHYLGFDHFLWVEVFVVEIKRVS